MMQDIGLAIVTVEHWW